MRNSIVNPVGSCVGTALFLGIQRQYIATATP